MKNAPPHKPAQKRKSITAQRVMLLGATGTIGRATLKALLQRGHSVTCFVRAKAGTEGVFPVEVTNAATFRFGEITAQNALSEEGFRGEEFDALVSCLASRTGEPVDTWAIDYQAHVEALRCAKQAGVRHVVLLSAICVQKPELAFQHAKLAFEKQLIASGLAYSIVRPTALFKSLCGQIDRLRNGKSFLVFGNGALTACKPISDDDLADYIAQCLEDQSLHNCILPIGGPGPAITPRQQGEALFALLGVAPRFSHVPVVFLDAIVWSLSALGVFSSALAKKAEFAKIGRYYATESMLVLDQHTGQYEEAATPSTGTQSLFNFYAQLIHSNTSVERGDHKVF